MDVDNLNKKSFLRQGEIALNFILSCFSYTPLKKFLLIVIMTTTTGCSTGYIIRAAYEQSKILLSRKSIDKIIADPSSDFDEEKIKKLKLVKEVRDFAPLIGLTPKNTFLQYAEVDGDTLVWVIVASKPTSFDLHTWWFPIVGSVPYKGFFDKEDALAESEYLTSQGYEYMVRGADAFSTLGWFDDPMLSTILRRNIPDLVNTIIHESVHTTFWIPGDVALNESLANFIGLKGAIEFFKTQNPNQELLEQSILNFERELYIADIVQELYRELDTMYKSDLSQEAKITKKIEIFNKHTTPLFSRYPDLKILRSANNAELIQIKLYTTGFKDFQLLFDNQGGSWSKFLDKVKELKPNK